jgi:hypothetical protein
LGPFEKITFFPPDPLPEDFKHFWKRVGEFTSLSMSRVHYVHYKVAIKCNISTKILAQQLAVVA